LPVSSVSYLEQNLTDVYAGLLNKLNLVLEGEDEVIEKSDVIFASVPNGLSEAIALKCINKNKKFIDFGADFRLSNEEDYTKWYGGNFTQKDLHKISCYCIPELNRNLITDKIQIIANPGCYPTSITLGLAPLLKNHLCDKDIIIDSKSGVTGAGRGLVLSSHFCEVDENFAPYKIGSHRHIPEIEQNLSALYGEKILVTFTPHLLPINRGIVSTMYLNKKTDLTLKDIHKIYTDFYKNEQFIRVLPLSSIACLKNVRMSNYCDISLHEDTRTGRIIVVSAIDNLVKGAAGQAVQNMNIIMHIEEGLGLNLIPSII
jgi:N-acetyl-gamma-glutamyl-phosphate reductase